MDVNGMKALEAIDPALEKWFYANGWTVPVAKTFDERGNLLMQQSVCKGQVPFCVWHDLCTAFLSRRGISRACDNTDACCNCVAAIELQVMFKDM